MIGLVELLVVPALIAFGAALLVIAARSRGLAKRIEDLPTRSVRELAAGLAEVEGVLRAETPLRTLDGAPAVAIRRVLDCQATVGSKTGVLSSVLDELECVPVELCDATGTCELRLDRMLLLATPTRRRVTRAQLASAYPELHARLLAEVAGRFMYGVPPERSVGDVWLTETYVADGARGFVSGRAEADGTSEADEGYRGGHARFRMVGTEEEPLILAPWSEREVHAFLARPARRLAWLGALCWAVAAYGIATVVVCAASLP